MARTNSIKLIFFGRVRLKNVCVQRISICTRVTHFHDSYQIFQKKFFLDFISFVISVPVFAAFM